MKYFFPSLSVALLVSFSLVPVASALQLPPGSEIKGDCEEKDGVLVGLSGTATYVATISGPITPEAPIFVLKGRLGTGGFRISLLNENGKFIAVGRSQLPMFLKPIDVKVGTTDLPRHAMQLSGGLGNYYVRPNPSLLNAKMPELRGDEWRTMPDAADYPFTFEMRPTGKGEIEMWMDGHYLQNVGWAEEAVSFEVDLRPGAVVESISMEEMPPPTPLILPMPRMTSTEKRVEGQVEFTDAERVPEQFRSLNGTTVSGLAMEGLGQVRGLRFDDLQSAFWRRHVTDRLENERMFSVPLATYSRARLLCAVNPSHQGANRFTFRVTRYRKSRGNAMADTIVEVPLTDAAGNPNAVQVGTVTPAGSEKPLPLWLVDVPIKNGLIQDLLPDAPAGGVVESEKDRYESDKARYLDIELMEPLFRVNEADAFPPPMGLVQRSWQPTASDFKGTDYFKQVAPSQSSSVIVFGALLEKSQCCPIGA